MPQHCKTKEEALKFIESMEEGAYPLLLDVWDADDIRCGYEDEEGEEVELDDTQVNVVMYRLAKYYSADRGITNDQIWNAVDGVVNAPKLVCKFCGVAKPDYEIAGYHQDGSVCCNCWDERLRATK